MQRDRSFFFAVAALLMHADGEESIIWICRHKPLETARKSDPTARAPPAVEAIDASRVCGP